MEAQDSVISTNASNFILLIFLPHYQLGLNRTHMRTKSVKCSKLKLKVQSENSI